MSELSAAAQRVQAALDQLGVACRVVSLPASTRTAAEAAATVGCTVGQIAKSLVFRAQASATPILVIASGSNRVDEARLSALVGEPIGKADAAFVRTHTGYAIGGVPPVGHVQPLRTFVDADLLQYDTIWAAAGTPNSVFALTPDDLVRITGGVVVRV
jgi:prolyl-tRNA editing enzyme YbaK/EbsC (Cys-tRNA(Pro) deacylase)